MYTLLSKTTLPLRYSIYPPRSLSSCLPRWNSTMLSIPAFSASNSPSSFLVSHFLVCLHAHLLLAIGLLSVSPTYISASTTSQNAIGFLLNRFVSLLSFYSSYVLAGLASCSPHRNFFCSGFISLHVPSYSTGLLSRCLLSCSLTASC